MRREYLLSSSLKIVPRVDILLYGDEDKCNKWFKKEVRNHMVFEPISGNHIDIYGIDIRIF